MRKLYLRIKYSWAFALSYLLGWKPISKENNAYAHRPEVTEYICLAAPHTSNWDKFICSITIEVIENYYRELDGQKPVRSTALFKKESLEIPFLGPIIRRVYGGVGVDRANPKNNIGMLKEVKKRIKEGHVRVLICPEGTRSGVTEWDPGYWTLAKMNKVPIYLYSIDYSTKTCHSLGYYDITGDYDKDSVVIEKMYKKEWAKYPEKFLTHDEMVAARKE